MESEYNASGNASSDNVWLRDILRHLNFGQSGPTPLHCDNQSAIRMVYNPEFHDRTKNIEVKYHTDTGKQSWKSATDSSSLLRPARRHPHEATCWSGIQTEPLENWRSGTRHSCNIKLEGKSTSRPRKAPPLIKNMITYSYSICVNSVPFNQFDWGEVLDKDAVYSYPIFLWRKSFLFFLCSCQYVKTQCDPPLFSCSFFSVVLPFQWSK